MSDVDELARLRYEMTAEDGDVREPLTAFKLRFQGSWDALMNGGRWTVWIAEAEGRLVGCAWLQRIERVPRPNHNAMAMGYLTNVYVAEAVRDRGIGSRLLAAVRQRAEEEDLAEVFVWPSERARSLYRRAGFTPTDEVHELMLRPDA